MLTANLWDELSHCSASRLPKATRSDFMITWIHRGRWWRRGVLRCEDYYFSTLADHWKFNVLKLISSPERASKDWLLRRLILLSTCRSVYQHKAEKVVHLSKLGRQLTWLFDRTLTGWWTGDTGIKVWSGPREVPDIAEAHLKLALDLVCENRIHLSGSQWLISGERISEY